MAYGKAAEAAVKTVAYQNTLNIHIMTSWHQTTHGDISQHTPTTNV